MNSNPNNLSKQKTNINTNSINNTIPIKSNKNNLSPINIKTNILDIDKSKATRLTKLSPKTSPQNKNSCKSSTSKTINKFDLDFNVVSKNVAG